MGELTPSLDRQITSTAREIIRESKASIPNAPKNDVIYGTVTAISATFPVTLTLAISGDPTNTIAGVACLYQYKPIVGDIVFCSKYGSDLVVLGNIGQRFIATVIQGSPALTGGASGASGTSGSYSIPFTPTAIGNLVVVFTGCSGTAVMSSFPTVSGGGVTTWHYGIEFAGTLSMVQIAWGVVTALGSSPVVISSYTPGGGNTTIATQSRVVEMSPNYFGRWSDPSLVALESSTTIGSGNYGDVGSIYGPSPCIGIYVGLAVSGFNGPILAVASFAPDNSWWNSYTGLSRPRTTMASIIDFSVNIGDYLNPLFDTAGGTTLGWQSIGAILCFTPF